MIAGVRLHIEVGGAIVQRCPRLTLLSRRHAPLSCAAVHLPDPDGSLAGAFAVGDAVRVEYGYRGGASGVWTGTVRGSLRVNRDQLCLLADGPDRALLTTRIRECYADESSEAIVRHLLGHTGLTIADVEIPAETIGRFPVANIPAWQAVRQLLHTLERAHGHDMRNTALWLGADGLRLGDLDEPGDVPVIATGDNLIRHQPSDTQKGLHTVETFLLPGLTHSRRFRLTDTRLGLDATHRALEVRHVIEPNRVRTFVGYGRENVWC